MKRTVLPAALVATASIATAFVFAGVPLAAAGDLISSADVKDNSLRGADIKDHSLTAKDFTGELTGTTGPQGRRASQVRPGPRVPR